jgi:hypothetical protein
MSSLYYIILIALGVAVLLLGHRLAVLGAAVGALLGVVLVRLLNIDSSFLVQLAVVLGLALVGFFAAAFTRGIIEVVILVLGALAGAAIVLGILDLFNADLGLVGWLLAVIGGVVGLILIRRARRGPRDWGMIILASLVGGLLVTRGITQLFPSMQDTIIATIVLVVAAAAGIAYQSGMLTGRKAAPAVAATTPPPPPTSASSSTPGEKPPK